MSMLSVQDKLRLLAMAKEIRAVIHMGREEEVEIEQYVDEVIEITEQLGKWIVGKEKVVRIIVRDGKRKTVDAREEIKRLGFHWNNEKKAWEKEVGKEDVENLSHELKDFSVVVE